MFIQGIISQVSQEETKTGKPYCKVTVLTPSKVIVNVWGVTSKVLPLFKTFEAEIKQDDLGNSCAYASVKLSEPTEEQRSWIPKPPTEEEWKSLIDFLAVKMQEQFICDKQVNFFTSQAKKLYRAYCVFPAGKTNHHSYAGGLARHTYEILNMYLHILPALPFETNIFVLATSALFHDAAKVRCYTPNSFEYTQYGVMVNHVAGSASMAAELMREEGFDECLVMYVEHCILAHHELLEYGSPVRPSCVEALTLAMLDRISGHGTQMAENATPNGTRVQNLGTTVFKI